MSQCGDLPPAAAQQRDIWKPPSRVPSPCADLGLGFAPAWGPPPTQRLGPGGGHPVLSCRGPRRVPPQVSTRLARGCLSGRARGVMPVEEGTRGGERSG